MKRSRVALKTFVALSIVFSLFAFAMPQASAAKGSWIYIHKADCLTTVNGDIFDNCHGNTVQGVDFTIGGIGVTTNSKGVAKAKVAAGTITITELNFLAEATAGKANVYCSVQPAGSPVLYDNSTTTGSVNIKVKDGTKVICDWYDRVTPPPPTPPTAWIYIHKADCPVTTTGDIFTKCHANGAGGVDFWIDGAAVTTNSKGVAKAKVTAAGDWTVTINEPDFATQATAGKAYVYCSAQPSGSPVLYDGNTTTGTVTIKLTSSDKVVCDWYDLTS
jgi:hypothetical protein